MDVLKKGKREWGNINFLLLRDTHQSVRKCELNYEIVEHFWCIIIVSNQIVVGIQIY